MLKASDIERAKTLVEKYDAMRRSYLAVIEDRAVVYIRVMTNGKTSDFDAGAEEVAKDYLESRLIALEDDLLAIGVLVDNPIKPSSEVVSALRKAAELSKQQEAQ
jgi:hypothetical protein